MPSGAKKRKAAKKKKEKEANINSSNGNNNNNNGKKKEDSVTSSNPEGNDDPKSQDERDSDGGESGSPASQDQQNHQSPFDEVDGESEKQEPPAVEALSTENEPEKEAAMDADISQKVEVEDDVAVHIERQLNSEPEQNVKHNDVILEDIDSAKESRSRDDSSCSSSSSDGESQAVEKENSKFILNGISCDEVKTTTDSFTEEVTEVPKNEKLAEDVDSNSLADSAIAAVPMSEVAQVPENENLSEDVNSKSFVDSATAAVPMSEVAQVPENEKPSEDEDVNGKSLADADTYMVPMSEVVKPDLGSTQVDNPEFVDVVEQGFKENEDKLPSNGITKVSIEPMVPGKNEDKIFPILDENVEAPSYVVDSTVNGNEGKLLTSSGVCPTETVDGAKSVKDSDASPGTIDRYEGEQLTPVAAGTAGTINVEEKAEAFESSESTENKSLLPSAPQVAQRASWLSCCGLFDIFAGFSR